MLLSGSNKNNTISGNYTYISDNGWHHNVKGGSSQAEKISTGNSKPDLDGTKNLTFNYNSHKFLTDSLKFKGTGYFRKTESGYDVSGDEYASGTNLMYALQSSLENRTEDKHDSIISHIHVYDRVYDEDVKNKYYSQSYNLKAEKKNKSFRSNFLGFGSDYNYNKGDFQVNGTYGNSARGHSDNLEFFSNIGYQLEMKLQISQFMEEETHINIAVRT